MRKMKLKEIGQILNGGTPATGVPEYWDGDIPWFTPYDLSKNESKVMKKGGRGITELGVSFSSATKIPPNSIMVSSRAPIGYVAMNKNTATTNQGMKTFVPDTSIANPDYIYYLFLKKKRLFDLKASGTTFKEISKTSLENIEVFIPGLHDQNDVSHALNSLVDKIELNRKIAAHLEEYAQLLFHKWFVDFNFPNEDGKPYKDNGGSMVEVDGKMIPEKWEVKSLKSLSTLKNGANYSISESSDNHYKVISVTQLGKSPVLFEDLASPIKVEEKNLNRYRIFKNDLVVARSANPGEVSLAMEDMSAIHSGFTIKITPENPDYAFIMYYRLNKLKNIFNSSSGGTILKNVTQQTLGNMQVTIPDDSTISEFNSIIHLIFQKIQHLQKEKNLLLETRDLLIKKLIK